MEILEQTDEAEPTKQTLKVDGEIEIQNVSFSYPSRSEFIVLNDLNFKIEPGEKVALVGPSGSGKSTIINLMMRFYPVNVGSVKVDSQNIQD